MTWKIESAITAIIVFWLLAALQRLYGVWSFLFVGFKPTPTPPGFFGFFYLTGAFNTCYLQSFQKLEMKEKKSSAYLLLSTFPHFHEIKTITLDALGDCWDVPTER